MLDFTVACADSTARGYSDCDNPQESMLFSDLLALYIGDGDEDSRPFELLANAIHARFQHDEVKLKVAQKALYELAVIYID